MYEKNILQEMLEERVPVSAFTDCKVVFDLCTTLTLPRDLRCVRDFELIRESLATGDVSEINWIRGSDNPADPLTKSRFGKARANEKLGEILETGIFDIPVMASVTSETFRRAPRPGLKFSEDS